MSKLENYFQIFRKNIIGIDTIFDSPYGKKKLVYTDWVASGRLYKPIEEKICTDFGPYVGNTHSESSITGMMMTKAYHHAQQIIKKHVNAGPEDIIITAGFGMTAVINKFQRILGFSIPEQLKKFTKIPSELRPVIFITHMEHHSNQTSWLETLADVVIIEPDELGLVDLNKVEETVKKYRTRKIKIGAFTSCSNVTGICTPYHSMAKIMHENGGLCFIDFAASAPYVDINMHPADPLEKIDAIYFSPHKFLGGPGTSGVLVFDSKLYKRKVPDHPGGGTVDWTNPWGQHKYVSDPETREDGGTPGFLQAIKTALCIRLKEDMGTVKIREREDELLDILFEEFTKIPKLHILASNSLKRLGIISFYIENIHYNLAVKLLNDRFGVQVRGGCSCAGTYGHYLLHVDPTRSKYITDQISHGDLSEKPGWIRMSLHQTMTNEELLFTIESIKQTIKYSESWGKDYQYSSKTNEFHHRNSSDQKNTLREWFTL